MHGANHLCVKIEYGNEIYLIEPYALKKTNQGKLILIAINHLSNERCIFQVEQIQKIEMLNITFNPKYLISLTPLKNNQG